MICPRIAVAVRMALLLLPVAIAQAGAAERFSVIALPDTQNYSKDPALTPVFRAQTGWAAANKDARNIAFVTHLGDIVNEGSQVDQWERARGAVDLLDEAGVRWGACMGNHDNQNDYEPGSVDNSCSPREDIDCNGENYRTYFGPQWFQDRVWYGGASPSELSNYQVFQVRGLKLLFLHFEVDPRPPELAWAQQVLDTHRDHAVHVTTHRCMYDYRIPSPDEIVASGDVSLFPLLGLLPVAIPGGRFTGIVHSIGGQDLYYFDATSWDNVFRDFIAKQRNVYMIQCGHVDAELRQVSRNDFGLDVHEMLADFQSFSPMGGEGWLRILDFDLDELSGLASIDVSTFSPWRELQGLDPHRKNGDGLDGALEALQGGLDAFGDDLADLAGIDPDALRQRLAFWASPEGREEARALLYDSGRRDSEFTLVVDFAAYVTNRPPLAEAGPANVSADCAAARCAVPLDGSASVDPDGDPLTFLWETPFESLASASPSASLPVGSHPVTLTVDDGRGGSESATLRVSVVDVGPPSIGKIGVERRRLSRRRTAVTLVPRVSDAADPAPVCSIAAVENLGAKHRGGKSKSKKRSRSKKKPWSRPGPDWKQTGDLSLEFGRRGGRVAVTVECRDAAGNPASRDVQVRVRPRSGGKKKRAG